VPVCLEQGVQRWNRRVEADLDRNDDPQPGVGAVIVATLRVRTISRAFATACSPDRSRCRCAARKNIESRDRRDQAVTDRRW
jgi:hypothetical protein